MIAATQQHRQQPCAPGRPTRVEVPQRTHRSNNTRALRAYHSHRTASRAVIPGRKRRGRGTATRRGCEPCSRSSWLHGARGTDRAELNVELHNSRAHALRPESVRTRVHHRTVAIDLWTLIDKWLLLPLFGRCPMRWRWVLQICYSPTTAVPEHYVTSIISYHLREWRWWRRCWNRFSGAPLAHLSRTTRAAQLQRTQNRH